MRQLTKETNEKWKAVIREVYHKTKDNFSEGSDLMMITRKYRTTNAITTFLKNEGALVYDNKNGFIWKKDYPYNPLYESDLDKIVIHVRDQQRESAKRCQRKRRLSDKANIEPRNIGTMPINFNVKKTFTDTSVPTVNSFLKQLPSDALIKAVKDLGYIVLLP